MKAKDILRWIVTESINGEFLGILDVPEEGEEEWQQNAEWWLATMGGVPPYPIPHGKYLYYHSSNIPIGDICVQDAQHCWVSHDADVAIELSDINGFSYVLLFKIDEE